MKICKIILMMQSLRMLSGQNKMNIMNCRFCNTLLTTTFIDLFNTPPSNSFLKYEQLMEPETYDPLKVYVCHKCFLVQVDEYKKHNEIFNDQYVYYSSFSTSWLKHSKQYAEMITDRLKLKKDSLVIEIASNDGYLLQYFKDKEIPVLGIEPTANTAKVAISKGINTYIDFFGTTLALQLANESKQADLFIGNNVLAHVPDIVDVVRGIKIILKDNGIVTMEFPHLLKLIENSQFDTIYHEHYSYLSFYVVKQIFESAGLDMFDVDEIPTHGGSLRIYVKHKGNASIEISENVKRLLQKELASGINTIAYYENFQKKAFNIKLELLSYLVKQKLSGKSIAAYGAAAKGNTLLNYCGIKSDIVDFVIDASPFKQNMYLPSSHIPVYSEDYLKSKKPDYVIILPWNLKEEIIEQIKYIKDWGGKFIIPIPHLEIIA